MNDPRNTTGRGDDRDRELAKQLNADSVPEHGATFWSDLDSALQSSTPESSDSPGSSAPGGRGTESESGSDPTLVNVIDLDSRRRSILSPLALAVASVAVVALGVAVWVSRSNTSAVVDVADNTVTAVEDDADVDDARVDDSDSDSNTDADTKPEPDKDSTGDGEENVTPDAEQEPLPDVDADAEPEPEPDPNEDGEQEAVSDPAGEATCSGTVELDPLNEAELLAGGATAAAVAKVIAIDAAAASCDWSALSQLVDPFDFTYSFGGDGSVEGAIESWQGGEEYWASEESLAFTGPMGYLRIIFRQPYGKTGFEPPANLWPAVFFVEDCDDFSDEDLMSLQELGYEDDQVCEAFGSYAGYRTAVEDDGRWTAFVEGD